MYLIMSTRVLSSALTVPGGKDWNNQLFDCFGMPGGTALCCYVLICPCCAAGDVAKFVHENFCATCCVLPCVFAWSCGWAANRSRLAEKFGIEDPYARTPIGCCVPVSLYLCGCRAYFAYNADCVHASLLVFILLTLVSYPSLSLVSYPLYELWCADICLLVQELNHIKAVQLSGGMCGVQPGTPFQITMS